MSFSRASILAHSALAHLLRITMRPQSALTALVAASVLLGTGCTQAPAAGQCSALLDHLVELEVNAGSAAKAEREAHKVELANETRDVFVKRCNTDLKASQVSCGLKAKTSEELESCDI